MALSLEVKKEDNKLGINLPNAYWYIREIGIHKCEEGFEAIGMTLSVYPDRDSRDLTEYVGQVNDNFRYDSVIKEYNIYFSLKGVDLSDISVNKLRTIGYTFIKNKYPDLNFKDV